MDKIVIAVDPDIADLIPGFLKNRSRDLAQLDAHLDAGDFDAVRVIGHSMKGAGGGYGFDRISELGADIEDAAKSGDGTAIRAAMASLEEYLSRVEITLDGG